MSSPKRPVGYIAGGIPSHLGDYSAFGPRGARGNGGPPCTSIHQPVEVRDRRNPDRVLGTLVRRPMAKLPSGFPKVLNVAVAPKVYSMGHPMVMAVDNPVDRATFDVSFRSDPDGYTQRAEFLTDAGLDLLLRIPDFRLPGETNQQADARRFA